MQNPWSRIFKYSWPHLWNLIKELIRMCDTYACSKDPIILLWAFTTSFNHHLTQDLDFNGLSPILSSTRLITPIGASNSLWIDSISLILFNFCLEELLPQSQCVELTILHSNEKPNPHDDNEEELNETLKKVRRRERLPYLRSNGIPS